VLTSDEGYAILHEKEEKKRKEKEEKEKKKQERQDKKGQKDELSRKKAEEKAKKAASKPRKPRRKQQDISKAAASASATLETSDVTELSATNLEVQTASEAVTTYTQNSSIELEHTCMSDTAATTALPGQEQEYECCECFGTFEEDII